MNPEEVAGVSCNGAALGNDHFAGLCESVAKLAAGVLDVPLVRVHLAGGRQYVFRRGGDAPRLTSALEEALRCGSSGTEGVLEEEVNRNGGQSPVSFYAGVAVEGEDGVLGSLYVFDDHKRRLTEGEWNRLQDLARLIASALEAQHGANHASAEPPPPVDAGDQYRHLMEHTSDAVFVTDLETGRVLDANKRAQRLVGHPLEELQEMRQEELHRSDSTNLLAILPASGHVSGAGLEMLHQDGRQILVEVTASVVEAEAGAVVQSIVRETDQHESAKRLQEVQGHPPQMAPGGKSLEATLGPLFQLVEAQIPDAYAAVGLLGTDGERITEVIAPGLPPVFAVALKGTPLEQAGPFGEAVRRDAIVRSDEVDAAQREEAAGSLLSELGLTRWIAAPLYASQEALGALVIYVPGQSRWPDEAVELAKIAQHTAGIAAARERTERALRESEERWQTLVYHHPEPILVHRRGRVLYGNVAAAELIDLPQEDLIGLSLYDFVNDAKQLKERLATLESGQAVPLQSFRITDQEGRQKKVESLGVPIIFRGQPAIQSALRDVTERRRAERELAESERQYRLLAENVSDVIMLRAPDGTCRYVSPSVQELTGRPPEALIGKTGVSHYHPDDKERIREARVALQRGEGVQATYRLRHEDGHYVWVETTDRAVFDEAGGVQEIVSVKRDITGRVEAEKEARMLSKAVEQSAEGIVVVSEEGIVEYANPAWAAMHGYEDARSLVGEPVSLFHTEDQLTHLVGPFIQQARKQGSFSGEMEHVRRDGTTFPTRISVTVLEDGEPGAFIGTACDITDRKEHERQLIEAKEEAEAMNQLKSTFLANMSHEIRTPLTGIIGFAEMLGEQAEGEYGEQAHLIEKSGRRLLGTLNSVLDLAQLEGNAMELHPSRFDLVELASEAVELFQPHVEEKDVMLRFAPPEASALPVEMDRSVAERILSNLLSNAVKFTEEGTIAVSLQVEDADVALEVTDTGVGIPEAFHPRLFETFQQASSGTSREYEGSGLGLTITKHLVDLLGATIEVESTEGVGSTFRVRLPGTFEDGMLSVGSARPEAEATAEPASDRRSILVVEDDVTTRKVIQLMLQDRYDVTAVSGLDVALAEAREQTFDVALLDINLGERRTGVEVMHAMRDLPEYDAVAMVACTAYALPGDEKRFLRAGFQEYVSKPIQKQNLLDTLDRACEADAPAADSLLDEDEIEIEVPPMPGTLPEVLDLASRDEEVPNIERLKQVLERDPVVSTRVLRRVNSAAYSLSQRVSSVDRAVTLLGFDPVCDMVLTEVLEEAFADYEEVAAAAIYELITKTSVATAAFARKLAHYLELEHPETAFSAGMLVQLGRLALLGNDPSGYAALWEGSGLEAKEGAMTAPTLGQEFLQFGADYVELGVRVGRQWELSGEILEILGHHRDAHRRGAAYHKPLTLAVSVGFTAAQNLYVPDRTSDVPEHESTNALKTLEELAKASGHELSDLALFLDEQREEVRRFVDAVC